MPMVKINLLPGSGIARARSASSANLSLIVGLCLLSGTMAVLPVILSRQVAATRMINEETERQIARFKRVDLEMARIKSRYETDRARLVWFDELQSKGLEPDRLMKEIRVLIPGDVWLDSLTVGTDKSASVTGFALSYDSVSEFISQLKLSPLCGGVELLGVRTQDVSPTNVAAFQLKLTVR